MSYMIESLAKIRDIVFDPDMYDSEKIVEIKEIFRWMED